MSAARKRGATGLSGVLLIDKPAGYTSHDVVARIRRATGEGRIGHAGTLDPMATGLMVVLVGSATRLEPFFSGQNKSYDAKIAFGCATDTDDAEGEVVRTAAIPDAVNDAAHAQAVLDGLRGDSMQLPPAYSAIKVDGKTAHRAARAGAPIELAARPITVNVATLRSIDSDPVRWDVRFAVSKGTYIRSLARDIGERVDSAAHLSALRRTASGAFGIHQAVALDDAVAIAATGSIATLWVDPVCALDMDVLTVEPHVAADGRPLDRLLAPHAAHGELLAVCSAAEPLLLGVYRVQSNRIVPQVIFAGGVTRSA